MLDVGAGTTITSGKVMAAAAYNARLRLAGPSKKVVPTIRGQVSLDEVEKIVI